MSQVQERKSQNTIVMTNSGFNCHNSIDHLGTNTILLLIGYLFRRFKNRPVAGHPEVHIYCLHVQVKKEVECFDPFPTLPNHMINTDEQKTK